MLPRFLDAGDVVEVYAVMAVCLVCFVGTIALFRFLIADRDQANMIGAAAGVLIAFAVGGAYGVYVQSCSVCI